MPIYKLQGPDGKIYKVEGPEGATAEQLGQFIMSQTQGRDTRAAAQLEADRKLYDPTVGMSGTEKFLAGTGKAFADIGRGVSQYLPGGATREDIAASRAQDAPLMNTGAGMAGNIAGNVAAAVPTAFIPGANTITGAGLIGAGMGALQPSVSTTETVKNIGIGGISSAAVPALVRGGQVIKAFIDPLSQSGRRQIVGRALEDAAGSAGTAQIARQNLAASNAPFIGPTPEGETARTIMGEIVPGSFPTTGQAAGVPSIAALSRSAGAVDAASTNALSQRLAEQNAARVAQLEGVAGMGGAREFLEANRAAVGNELYGNARRIGIDPAALTPEAQSNIAAFQQRVPDEIMQRARDLARINGVDMSNESSVQGLHWIKTALDDRINTAARSGDRELVRAYTGLQNTLLNGLDQISPAYGEARRTYAAMSRPINEMQVAQTIADRAINPMADIRTGAGTIKPEMYAKALNDRTAATTLGRTGATLENTMEPRNLQRLQNIQEDLERAKFALTAGKESGGSDTAQKLAYSNLLTQSGLPNWVQSLAGRTGIGGLAQKTGQVVYRDANQQMSQMLAHALLNPQEASMLMEAGMVTPQMIALANGLRRGGTALGATAPGLVQANQQ